MTIPVFKLEDYLARYEFSAPYLLCCSDPESFFMHELIALADENDKNLWDNLQLSYTESWGLPLLRDQIVKSLYPTLKRDNILCFAGAEDGIFSALYTLCNEGDHVIAFSPCYQSLLELPRLKKAEVTTLPLRKENGWRINLDEVKKAIKNTTKCIVINFPHNPTGQVITKKELQELVQLCAAHDLWLFSDEVYRLLGTPVEPWAPPAAEIYPKALSLGVMSKAFGMAGLRIGWIACQNKEMLKEIKQMKHYTTICNSAPSEILSLITLKNKETILSRNNAIVAHNLQLLDDFIQEYTHLFEWIRPQGGCVGFVHYKGKEPIEHFSERLIKEKGVLIMPGSIYDHPGNYFRIGFGRKNMPESLEKFKEFLQ